MVAWLQHAECQLQAVDQVFFAVIKAYMKDQDNKKLFIGDKWLKLIHVQGSIRLKTVIIKNNKLILCSYNFK